MEINYEIIEKYPQENQIVVRVWSDEVSEEELRGEPENRPDGRPVRCRTDMALDLPIPTPSGQALHDFIMVRINIDWLAAKGKIKASDPDIDFSKVDLESGIKTVSEQVVKDLQKPVLPVRTVPFESL